MFYLAFARIRSVSFGHVTVDLEWPAVGAPALANGAPRVHRKRIVAFVGRDATRASVARDLRAAGCRIL